MTGSTGYSSVEWERVRAEGMSYGVAYFIYIPAYVIASIVAAIVIAVTGVRSWSESLELQILGLAGRPR
jgi:hypothetical protein